MYVFVCNLANSCTTEGYPYDHIKKLVLTERKSNVSYNDPDRYVLTCNLKRYLFNRGILIRLDLVLKGKYSILIILGRCRDLVRRTELNKGLISGKSVVMLIVHLL